MFWYILHAGINITDLEPYIPCPPIYKNINVFQPLKRSCNTSVKLPLHLKNHLFAESINTDSIGSPCKKNKISTAVVSIYIYPHLYKGFNDFQPLKRHRNTSVKLSSILKNHLFAESINTESIGSPCKKEQNFNCCCFDIHLSSFI